MKRSPMPRGATESARVIPLRPGQPAKRNGLRAVRIDGESAGWAVPLRARPKDTIPKDVRALVNDRDYGLCVHCSKGAEHIHHRRIKGMGGSLAPHSDCACVLVSLCHPCHDWVHAYRYSAAVEGLIIPRATPLPYLLPVLVHGPGSGVKAWPSCDGRWLSYEPDTGGAA